MSVFTAKDFFKKGLKSWLVNLSLSDVLINFVKPTVLLSFNFEFLRLEKINVKRRWKLYATSRGLRLRVCGALLIANHGLYFN